MLPNLTNMEPNPPENANYHAQQLETIGLLASGIAHDFNNLLASILGQSSLALATLPPENSARTHIEKAMKAAEFAAELTRQLLNYANTQEGPREAIDLNQLINDNISLLNMTMLNGVVLKLDLSPNLPSINARRAHIQQLVMNLIINAAEAIETNPGIVLIRTGKRAVLANEKPHHFVNGRKPAPGEYVFFQVSDTGPGIDRTTQTRIFDPFYTTKTKGRGLGLSTVLEIVLIYDGGIMVESKKSQGTTFTVLLPVGHYEGKDQFTKLH